MSQPRYRGTHRRVRAWWAPQVATGRVACCRCGELIGAREQWHLDHTDDGRGWRGPAHAVCNTRAGGTRSATLRAQRKRRTVMDPSLEVCLGIEVALDRSHTSVVAAAEQGQHVLVELVRYVPGADAADAVAEVAGDLWVVGVALDPVSTTATLIRPLTDHKLAPTLLSASDTAAAFGLFVDLHRAERLRLVQHDALIAALRAADQRARGERSVLDRRASTTVDGSPVLAAQWAVWCLKNLPPPPPEPNIW
jgi:hypothetical protein